MPSVVKFEKRQPQFIREASILTILVGRGGKNRTPMDTFCASFQQFREPKTLQDMDTCLDTLCLEGEGCRQFSATLEDTGGVVLLKGITNVQDTRWLRSCRQELAVVCGLLPYCWKKAGHCSKLVCVQVCSDSGRVQSGQ